jgi:hypothetical protein
MRYQTYTYRYRTLVHPLPRVHVDFNDLDTDGQLYARLADSDVPLQADSQVILWDGEGNYADGRVVAMTERGDAVLAMVPDSWREDETPEPSGFWGADTCPYALPLSRVAVFWLRFHDLHGAPVRYHVSQAAGKAPETAPPGALEEIGTS